MYYLFFMTLACSKRSDSGERCGVEKAMKSRGGLLPRFYFFALPFTLHRSPLSERLEQAIMTCVEEQFRFLFLRGVGSWEGRGRIGHKPISPKSEKVVRSE